MDIASSITRQRSDTDELVARSGVNMAVLESRIRLGIRSVAMGITEGLPQHVADTADGVNEPELPFGLGLAS